MKFAHTYSRLSQHDPRPSSWLLRGAARLLRASRRRAQRQKQRKQTVERREMHARRAGARGRARAAGAPCGSAQRAERTPVVAGCSRTEMTLFYLRAPFLQINSLPSPPLIPSLHLPRARLFRSPSPTAFSALLPAAPPSLSRLLFGQGSSPGYSFTVSSSPRAVQIALSAGRSFPASRVLAVRVRVCIEILWPLILFFILMWVRTRGLRLFIHECHFDAKAMPSAGLLPFAQSTVCTLNNTCHREEATQRASEQQYNASLLIQLVSDVNHIVNEHLTNEDTVNSIKRLSRDLEALSAFVKKLTNTEFPLSGMVALEDVMKNDEKTRYSFEALNISNKDFYPAFFRSSISVRALQKIFDRGKDDLQAYFCKPGAPLLLFVAGYSEEGGKQRQLQRDLCKLSASDGRALTLQVKSLCLVFSFFSFTPFRSLCLPQVSSITRESGHDLSISDWVTAFQLAQDARNEARPVWALSSFQELLAGLADRVSQVSGLLVMRSRSSSGGREEAGSRLMRLVQVSVCGRNVSSLLDAEQGPPSASRSSASRSTRNLQEQRDEPLVSEYVYDNSTSLAAEWKVYPKSGQDLKSSDRDLAPFLSKQEKPGEGSDVPAFWAGMSRLSGTPDSNTFFHCP
ncbi:hypothetical protein HPB48_009315 [Haemaphysalis longicornis]|uniref:Uncharacterized protein n=1 Tax=Haemaphysalis longicornis TaxID=44386 RepID=A0A9J6FUB9_HAELO|nr:hypothetical protein HPB48_009315 [Haemaphysalis longicornis]